MALTKAVEEKRDELELVARFAGENLSRRAFGERGAGQEPGGRTEGIQRCFIASIPSVFLADGNLVPLAQFRNSS